MTRQLTDEQKAAKKARAAARKYRRAAGLEVPAKLAKEIKQAQKADRSDAIKQVAARLAKETIKKNPIATVEGTAVYLGDFVGFKDDIEQYGKVVGRQGSMLILEARDQRTDEPYETSQAIDRCWID